MMLRAVLSAAACLVAGLVQAHDIKLGALTIEHPYARATPSAAQVAGGYLRIVNRGSEADRLLGGSADFAARVEIHQMMMVGDVVKMRHLPDGLEIPAGGELVLEPGGAHIMFMKIAEPFRKGEFRTALLRFEKAGEIVVDFSVAAMGTTN